jgi:hypothetical protein
MGMEITMGPTKCRETILLHLEGTNMQTEQGGTTTHEQRPVQRTAGTSRLLAAAATAASSGGRPESRAGGHPCRGLTRPPHRGGPRRGSSVGSSDGRPMQREGSHETGQE